MQQDEQKSFSNELGSLFFEYAADPIFFLDFGSHRFVNVNQAACDHSGYSRGELLQMGPKQLDAPTDQSKIAERLAQLKRDGKATFEAVHIHRSGRQIPVEMNLRMVEHAGKLYTLNICRDLTERKATDAAAHRSKLILETALDGFWRTDGEGYIREVNRSYADMIGYSNGELLSMHISQLDAHDDPQNVQARIGKIIEHGHLSFETQHRHKDGHLIDIEVSTSYLRESGEFFVFSRDISERKRAEKTLRESEARLATLLDRNKIHMWAFDGAKYTYTNKQWFDYTGQDPDDLLTIDRWTSVVHPDDLESSGAIWHANWASKTEHDNHFRLRRHDGVYRDFICHAVPIFDEHGVFQYFQGFNLDITERKEMEDQIRQLAFYDVLTHLPNRRMLNDRLNQALALSKRTGRYGALMFIDLDNFKPLNDQHGHEVGDLVLIDVSQRLTNNIREMDTVARFGGDEFVVMLSELEQDRTEATEHAAMVAKKILATLAEPYEITIPDGISAKPIVHRCSASIGVAMFINHEGSREQLLKWADIAMYQAKAAGRNQIRFHQASAK